MAKIVSEKNIPSDNIYKLSEEHTWALDFYDQNPVKIVSLENLKETSNLWVYVSEEELILLNDSGFDWDKQYTVDDFRITRLQAKFLNPTTRKKTLHKKHLIHIFK